MQHDLKCKVVWADGSGFRKGCTNEAVTNVPVSVGRHSFAMMGACAPCLALLVSNARAKAAGKRMSETEPSIELIPCDGSQCNDGATVAVPINGKVHFVCHDHLVATVTGDLRGEKTVYCVMIPTHRNPKGRFDFKWRRKFGRGHHEIIMKNVALIHGGYTLILPSEGCWKLSPDRFQVESMCPFLFTAENRLQADIIADLVAIHYDQDKVMTYVWGYGAHFRKQWEMIPFYTNMLRPRPKEWRLRRCLGKLIGRRTSGS
jgi:hypothetical protein